MPWTAEQLQVLDHVPQKGQMILVTALPGTGKTTVCEALIKRHAHPTTCKIFFTMLSAKLAQEAKERLQEESVECGTFHSMALGVMQKISENPLEVADIVENVEKGVFATLENYWKSVDRDLQWKHTPPMKTKRYAYSDAQRNRLWMLAQGVQTDMEMGRRPVTHLAYLKMCTKIPSALTTIASMYDCIIVDEAQDVPPCFVSLLVRLQPHCCIYLVGDPNQQIFLFSGAASAFSVQGTHHFTLSQSFRFGPTVAQLANKVVQTCRQTKDVAMPNIISDHQEYKTIVMKTISFEDMISSGQQFALICRVNMTILEHAMILIEHGISFHIVGEPARAIIEYIVPWAMQYDAWAPESRNALAASTRSKYYTRPEGGGKEVVALNFAEKHQRRAYSFDEFARYHTDHPSLAQVILVSAHQSKGMEFDLVVLADDYPDIFAEESLPNQDEETNIIFVAMTRCKKHLILNKTLSEKYFT